MTSITSMAYAIISGTSVVPTNWGVEITLASGDISTLYYTTRAEARIAKNFFGGMTSNVERARLV